jgi:putative DNA primase/helicase
MSDASTIARALDGVRNTNGNGYLCRCPLPTHGKGRGDRNRSLSIRDGDSRILVTCFAGCRREDVIGKLKRRNLLPSYNDHACDHQDRCERRTGKKVALYDPLRERANFDDVVPDCEALSIWHESALASGTVIESKYLTAVRGIVIAAPPSLRYFPLPYQDRLLLPAMIAAVQAPDPGRKVIAVQATWLDPPPRYTRVARKNFGQLGYGAVRLDKAGEVLGLAEGVETALAAMQLHGVPVWATLGAKRMSTVVVPDTVRKLIVFGDNDEAGHAAAEGTERCHAREGRRVALCFPPAHFKDWADVTARPVSSQLDLIFD